MAGNVWEWVYDGADNYPKNEVTNPVIPGNEFTFILRGGNWWSTAKECRAAHRDYDHIYRLGFRPVRTL